MKKSPAWQILILPMVVERHPHHRAYVPQVAKHIMKHSAEILSR